MLRVTKGAKGAGAEGAGGAKGARAKGAKGAMGSWVHLGSLCNPLDPPCVADPRNPGKLGWHGSGYSGGVPKSHTELICWQLANQLRQLIIAHTNDGSPAAQDQRFTRTCATRFRLHVETSPKGSISTGIVSNVRTSTRREGRWEKPRTASKKAESEDTSSTELACEMDGLCGRAMIANLRWLSRSTSGPH